MSNKNKNPRITDMTGGNKIKYLKKDHIKNRDAYPGLRHISALINEVIRKIKGDR